MSCENNFFDERIERLEKTCCALIDGQSDLCSKIKSFKNKRPSCSMVTLEEKNKKQKVEEKLKICSDIIFELDALKRHIEEDKAWLINKCYTYFDDEEFLSQLEILEDLAIKLYEKDPN